MSIVEDSIQLLGTQMKDIVTGYRGMVDSVGFDAYGCVQVSLKPSLDKDGKIPEGYWFDVKRVVPSGTRIMKPPPLFTTPTGQEIGAAEKPRRQHEATRA